MVAVRDLVPNHREPGDISAPTDLMPVGASFSRSRRQRPREEPTSVHDRMEHKRGQLDVMGLDEFATAIILQQDRNRARLQYSYIQRRYITWCNAHNVDPIRPIPSA